MSLASATALAQTLPPLNFDAPPGFAGGGSDDAAIFTSPERDLSIHIYPFRRLGPGDFQARFRETLLREFVSAGQREGKLAEPARIETFAVEGAEAAQIARFTDANRERSRLAMHAAGGVAIVDIVGVSGAAARNAAAVKELLDSISVGQPKARAAPAPLLSTPELASAAPAAAAAAAPAVAAAPAAAPPPPLPPGLYVGTVRRLIPQFVGGVQSGGMWVNGPQYYVLYSGYVHRTYEQPRLPEGDASRFDWERARREDAANTGTYQLAGGELTMSIGTETISAKLAGPGRFDILGTQFRRTAAR
ncbi:MAG TPA: hypothetical protein VGI18_05870 [Burkholderiales bacterium]